MTKFRDKIACSLCNFILNHVASEWYRERMEEVIAKGLNDEAVSMSRSGAKVVYVTPAQVKAAKLLIELNEGVDIDPAIVAIANARRKDES
jgi:hypothetical protein